MIFVSDNESWVDARHGAFGTQLLHEWQLFKRRNREAKLVCIDLQPNRTTQAHDAPDVLNVGGFSDAVFEMLTVFTRAGLDGRRWVEVIEDVKL